MKKGSQQSTFLALQQAAISPRETGETLNLTNHRIFFQLIFFGMICFLCKDYKLLKITHIGAGGGRVKRQEINNEGSCCSKLGICAPTCGSHHQEAELLMSNQANAYIVRECVLSWLAACFRSLSRPNWCWTSRTEILHSIKHSSLRHDQLHP